VYPPLLTTRAKLHLAVTSKRHCFTAWMHMVCSSMTYDMAAPYKGVATRALLLSTVAPIPVQRQLKLLLCTDNACLTASKALQGPVAHLQQLLWSHSSLSTEGRPMTTALLSC
jgi:hypothetical protein